MKRDAVNSLVSTRYSCLSFKPSCTISNPLLYECLGWYFDCFMLDHVTFYCLALGKKIYATEVKRGKNTNREEKKKMS